MQGRATRSTHITSRHRNPRATHCRAKSALSTTPPLHNNAYYRSQWYPAVPESYVSNDKPVAFELMGERIVIWRNGTGAYSAASDSCPHRGAPLSQGSVNPSTGCLQCKYHGWQFDGSGACTHVPQKQEGTKLVARRSGLDRAAQTAVAYGLVWVSLEPGEATKAPPVIPDMEEFGGHYKVAGHWYMRDLPVNFENALENAMDLSHIYFVHNGILEQSKNAGDIHMDVKTESNPSWVLHSRVLKGPKPDHQTFYLPSIKWVGSRKEKYNVTDVGILTAYTPSGPGRTRIFFSTIIPSIIDSKVDEAWVWAANSMTWLRHRAQHPVHDGDISVMHDQKNVGGGGGAWAKEYYMPARCDAGVIAVRKYLDAVGRPDMGAATTTTRPDELYDRAQQHIKHCPHCQHSEYVFKRVVALAVALLVVVALVVSTLR